MSFQVPTLEQLVNLAQERHRAEMPGTDAYLWPNTEYVFTRVVAGMVHMNFEYLGWIKRQRFATEADGDELDAHGRALKLPRNAATRAHGKVVIEGTPGHALTAGDRLARSDEALFQVIEAGLIPASGQIEIAVEAVDAGRAGNTLPLTPMTMQPSTSLITRVVVDRYGIGAGADAEGDDAYRARILFRLQNPPRGGAVADYIHWTGRIAGTTRVWVSDLAFGPGTIAVWFMADGSTPNGIPSQPMVDDVAAYIETVRPTGIRKVLVAAPLPAALDVRVNGLAPNLAKQALIEKEVRAVFERRVRVGDGKTPYIFKQQLLEQAVRRIAGDEDFSLSLPGDTVIPRGYVPVFNRIGFA
jgi:uncharacterized phage protein gp47/JayE